MDARERMILALDVEDFQEARDLVGEFREHVGMFKVGKQLFTHCGPKIVDLIKELGGRIFLDLKYHDIPNTVSKAAVEATKLGVDMFNVHASGGVTMMRQAREAIYEASEKIKVRQPKIIAVTVLTSIDDAELVKMGLEISAREFTRRLALLTREAGLDGVVASGQEIEMIRDLCGSDFIIVTPGVRITETKDDQKRTIGPREAIQKGATYIVLGRTVLTTANPKETLKQVEEQIKDALSGQ
ncbi:MAG: Orotidine 5'-phosphate decarboxylase [Syntrophorhabdaceae bacterium PtaU1.Bin034]|nr:MAG: Orotidine 5'-phosphate decarboxylase [Syntrophorhabdaceae bacterium PtaU1.Bin034]